MTLAFAPAAVVERIGWLLVHSVWQFTLIALLLAIVLRAMRRAPAGARYVAALVGWGLMLAAPALTWVCVPISADESVASLDTPRDAFELLRRKREMALPDRPMYTLVATEPGDVSESAAPASGGLATDSEQVTAESLSPLSAWSQSLAAAIAPWLNTLVVIWCLGVCAFAARSAHGWYVVRRLLQRDVSAVSDEMTSLLVRVLQRIGLRHRVRLLQSPHVDVPLVVGWLRPVILLPVCVATGFAPQQLEAILAHELAHIRRHDYLINLLQTLSETVFFYHPALWWASAVVRREREHCCDELAARALGNRAEYGRALLALEELRGETPALALGAKGGSLLERIRRLTQMEPSARFGAGGVIGIGVVAAVVLTTAVWTAGMAQEAPASVATSGEAESEATVSEELPAADKQVDADAPGIGSQAVTLPTVSANELALRAHAQAAAIDSLPRFFVRSHAGSRNRKVIVNADADPVANMLRELDAPVVEAEWYQYEPVFAWDERHFLEGTESPKAYGLDQPEAQDPAGNPRSIHYRWGTRELGAAHEEIVGRHLQCIFRKDAAAMWENCILNSNFLRVTPHQFWWGDTSHDNQTFNRLPPASVEYRLLANAEFDGEACHVVESPARQERLWISQQTGLIRGYLKFSYHGPMTKFYEADVVTEVAGKRFTSQFDYGNWYRSEFDKLPLEKRTRLLKAWSDTMDFATAVPSMLMRFGDYREIAPGVWWPFREDLVSGHKGEQGYECVRGTIVSDEVRLDVDLQERVQGLMPKEGEQVQDQRYAVPVTYNYSSALTEAEILKLVDVEYQKRLEGEEAFKRMVEPVQKLGGEPALTLPDEGWVGGTKPDVTGKPYLLHFWATWCGPCKNDLPLLKRMADDGALIIGMHPTGTSAEEIQTAIDEHQLSYPTFVETQDQPSGPGRTIAGYPADMFPYCILVDAAGRVAAHGSLMSNGGEILAKFRELRTAVDAQPKPAAARPDTTVVAAADELSASDSTAKSADSAPDDRVHFTIIAAKHVLLLDGRQIVTWQEIDAKIAALPDPSRAFPALYVTRGAMDDGQWDATQKETHELHRKYNLSGHSIGSLMPRTDVHYDRIQTPADLVPDTALRREGTVVDADGKPVAGVEVVLITPVDDSLSYKDYDIYLVSGRIRNPLDEVLTRTDEDGRFAVYPPKDTPFNLLALHPDSGVALIDGEWFAKEPKLTLLRWGGVVAEFSQESEPQESTLWTGLDATDTRPAISLTQYWSDLNRPDPTLVFEYAHVPPIWQTSIQRSFRNDDGGSTSIPGASVDVLPGETRRITLGPVTEQQRELLKGIRN